MQPRLSLVIATYNRSAKLVTTLESVVRQTLDPKLWEAIVVNNNSSDDTAEVFAVFAAKYQGFNLRMIMETAQGVSPARNRGVEESAGLYIVVIDDDEIACEELLETYYRFFEDNPEIAAAGGKILPRYESEPPEWISRYTERAIAGTLDLGEEKKPFPDGKFFAGGNHAFRRDIVDKYGLYDPELGRTGNVLLAGEEKDLYMRLKDGGEQIWYLPDAVIYHLINPERLTRSYFEKLCFNIGRSERVRTLNISKGKYAERLIMEMVKWLGASVLAVGYLLKMQPWRGWYLIIMRAQVTRGLFSR